MFKPLRRLYDWVLHWAETPYGTPALFVLAFAESSFFPVPPDILLIALSISKPRNFARYALVCTLGSVLGGVAGYYIGYAFWETVGQGILMRYVTPEAMDAVKAQFDQYQAWAVAIAGLTPIPYKIFTITAGFLEANLAVFVIASALSRGARFFVVAGLIRAFGEPIRAFIDRYFNALTVAFAALLVGGFVLVRYLL
jgi:membrane protein YqaA with SNARE-associated domain